MSRRTTKTATNTHTVTHLSTNCTPEGHPIVKIPLISRLVPYIYAVADTVKVRDFFFRPPTHSVFAFTESAFFAYEKTRIKPLDGYTVQKNTVWRVQLKKN